MAFILFSKVEIILEENNVVRAHLHLKKIGQEM
jgi:hypothetical protein